MIRSTSALSASGAKRPIPNTSAGMSVRRLRFIMAGRMFAACLWVMPRGWLRDTLIDHVIDWRDERCARACVSTGKPLQQSKREEGQMEWSRPFEFVVEELDLFTEDGAHYGMANRAVLNCIADPHNGWFVDTIDILGQKKIGSDCKIVMTIPHDDARLKFMVDGLGDNCHKFIDMAYRAVCLDAPCDEYDRLRVRDVL